MDMLDQQMLLAQYSESRRNARRQQQVDQCTIIGSPTNKLGKHTWSVKNGEIWFLCVGWADAVDQVISLTETQGAEPTPNAAPPTGSDGALHTASATGQLSGRRGSGGSSSSLCQHRCLVDFAYQSKSLLILLTICEWF